MRTRLLSAALAASALVLLAGCAGGGPAPTTPDSVPSTPAATGSAPMDAAGTCLYSGSGTAAREVSAPEPDLGSELPATATLQTSAGDVEITLTGERTPCTVASFVSLAEQDYFTDTECHRLTTSGIFVLQCGDPSGTGRGGPGYRFDDELDGTETYGPGTVAMANAGPDTNGSQFFLVYDDSPLPPDYTVFGQMDAAGLDVVRAVGAAGASGGGADGPPATPVIITGVVLG